MSSYLKAEKLEGKNIIIEWYYSIVDIIEVLTISKDAGAYLRKLKHRLKEEDFSEFVTKCHELKLPSKKDEKKYKADCANRMTWLF